MNQVFITLIHYLLFVIIVHHIESTNPQNNCNQLGIFLKTTICRSDAEYTTGLIRGLKKAIGNINLQEFVGVLDSFYIKGGFVRDVITGDLTGNFKDIDMGYLDRSANLFFSFLERHNIHVEQRETSYFQFVYNGVDFEGKSMLKLKDPCDFENDINSIFWNPFHHMFVDYLGTGINNIKARKFTHKCRDVEKYLNESPLGFVRAVKLIGKGFTPTGLDDFFTKLHTFLTQRNAERIDTDNKRTHQYSYTMHCYRYFYGAGKTTVREFNTGSINRINLYIRTYNINHVTHNNLADLAKACLVIQSRGRHQNVNTVRNINWQEEYRRLYP